MSIYGVDHVAITGLSNSGTTDNAGTWNEDIDLDSFSVAPTGATGVVLRLVNTTFNSRWFGVRTPGKTAARMLMDAAANNSVFTVICALGAGNTIDLYTEEASVQKVYIVGYTGPSWTFTDIDSPDTLTSTGSSWTTRTCSSAPTGATAALIGPSAIAGWRPTGAAGMANAMSGDNYAMLAQLDGSKQFDLNSSSTVSIHAYVTTGMTWETWKGTTVSATCDSSWRDAGNTNAGKGAVLLLQDSNVAAYLFNSRMNGSSYNTPAGAGVESGRSTITGLDAGGAFEYNGETGGTATIYVLAWFDTFGASVAVTSVDSTLDNGQTGVTITGSGFKTSQGTGKVIISPTDDVDDVNAVKQYVTTWSSDTSITFTAIRGALQTGNHYLFVVNDDGDSNASGTVVSFNGLTPLILRWNM